MSHGNNQPKICWKILQKIIPLFLLLILAYKDAFEEYSNAFLLSKEDMFSIRWQGAQHMLWALLLWWPQKATVVSLLRPAVTLGEGVSVKKKMQLANIISSNPFRHVSFPCFFRSHTKSCVYFPYQAMHTFCSSLLHPVSSDTFLMTPSRHQHSQRWQRQGEAPCLFCFFPPPSTNDLSQCSTSLEMTLFLFKSPF